MGAIAFACSLAPAQVNMVRGGGLQGYGALTYRESAASRASLSKFSTRLNLSVGIRSDGTLVQWGGPDFGADLQMPLGPIQAVDVRAGIAHFLAQKADGTLIGWGRNADGEATVPAGLGSVIGFDAGNGYSLAVKGNGTVVGWGFNLSGRLDIPGGLSNVTQVATGDRFALALKSNGTVVQWGWSDTFPNPPAGLSNVIQIAANYNRAMALRANGTVIEWGIDTDIWEPYAFDPGWTGIVKIAAGFYNALGLKSNGFVEAYGQGTGLVGVMGHPNVVDIAAGEWSSMLMRSDGTFRVFGPTLCTPPNLDPLLSVSSGQGEVFDPYLAGVTNSGKAVTYGLPLYLQYLRNVPTDALSGVVQVGAGQNEMVALKSDGTLVAWGLGATPPATPNIKKIAVGSLHGLTLKTDGTVVGWGDNTFGQTDIPAGLNNVIDIAAGDAHSMALESDGTVVCWGQYEGVGPSVTPAGLTGVFQIAAIQDCSMALKSDGTLAIWGRLIAGEETLPSLVTNVKQLAPGREFAVALKNDGTVLKIGDARGGPSQTWNGAYGLGKIAGGDAGYGLPSVYLEFPSANAPGDSSLTGTLVLPVPPGPGGADVTIATTDVTLAAPGTVHVNEGQNTVTFPFTTGHVVTPKVVHVSATYGGFTAWAAVTLSQNLNKVTTIDLSWPNTVGGSTFTQTATVHMLGNVSGDVTVTLTSSDPSRASVPATVVVPNGANSVTFPIDAKVVGTVGAATITASAGGGTAQVNYTVYPLVITNFYVDPYNVIGGATTTGTVKLTAPTLVDRTINLLSTNTSFATVPATVVVPAGSDEATFTVSTISPPEALTIFIKGGFNGSLPKAKLTVAPPAIASLTMPVSLFGRQDGSGTITLATPAPAGGFTVNLASNNAALSVPPTVTFAAGTTTANFPFTSGDPTADTTVTVTASVGSNKKTRAVLVKPMVPTLVKLSGTSTIGGSTLVVTGTVTLAGFVAQDTVVSLTSSNSGIASVPATVTVLAGDKTATFTVSHEEVTATTAVTITATRAGASVTTNLDVKPNDVSSITLAPSTVTGGQGSMATVTLTAPVRVDTVITITVSLPGVAMAPGTVTVLAGTSDVTFNVSTVTVNSLKTVKVYAKKGVSQKLANLSVTP